MKVTFGDVTLDPEGMQLERRGLIVAVEPQVFEVLAYLVAHRDRLVPKTELLDEIWGDRFVSESALSSRIKSARRAIGDNGRDQRLIRTVHGRGFRFVGVIDVPDLAGRLPGRSFRTVGAQSARIPRRGADSEPDERRGVSEGGMAGGGMPGGGMPGVGDDLVATVLDALGGTRGVALAVVGRFAAARTEAVDDVLFAASAEDVPVGRGGGANGLRAFGSVLDALDELVRRRVELLDAVPPMCRDELTATLGGEAPSSRQRLFVAVQELLVAAGSAGGAVVAVEDVHLADRPTLDLLDLMARTARRVGVALVVTHRTGFTTPGDLRRIDVDGSDAPGDAAAPGHRVGPGSHEVPMGLRGALARAAAIGEPFDRSVFCAATGLDAPTATRALAVAGAEGILDEERDGHRFRDATVGDELARMVSVSERREVLRAVALQLEADGADPDRIARCLDEAGDVEAAAPHHLAAATNAAWGQRHAEVLRHTVGVDAVDDQVIRTGMLELRADALAAGGDPEAVRRYRDALRSASPAQVPWLRARLGRAHLVAGDIDAAAEVLAGVAPTGGPFDGGILLIRGMLAYFQGDLDLAEKLAVAARDIALAPGAPPQMLDVIALQGMIAHSRGQWFDRLRRELRATAHSSELAATVFDAHVCVGQFLLYGPTGHDDVVRLAAEFRQSADRMGSRRAAGFSTTLEGEVMLLAGDLGRAGELLAQSVDLHREIGADTGLAHALQRLAEVKLAEGDRAGAEQLCRQALPLARWSPISRHLLQRIAGTLIAAAPDAAAAAAAADDAFATLDDPAACLLCQVMLAVPAAMAYAAVGRLEDARHQVEIAARSARCWEGPAWPAAVTEAEAAVARAEGRHDEADALLRQATAGFVAAAQPLDAARCNEAIGL